MSSRPANDLADVRHDGFFADRLAGADPAVAEAIAAELEGLRDNGHDGNGEVEAKVRKRVRALCRRFPIYLDL